MHVAFLEARMIHCTFELSSNINAGMDGEAISLCITLDTIMGSVNHLL